MQNAATPIQFRVELDGTAVARGPVRRTGRALATIGLILVVCFMVVNGATSWLQVVQWQVNRLNGPGEANSAEDYITFYAAGRLVADGRGTDLYDVDAIRAVEHEAMGRPVGGSGVLAYFNPPFVAAAFAPLALLPVEIFSTVLLGLVLMTLLGGGLALKRFLRLTSTRENIAFWLFFLSLHASVWLVVEQQLSMLLLAGWLGFAWAQHQGNPRASGLSLALILVKPQMALLPVALLVWNRQWQALKAFGAAAAILVAVSILISGPSILVEYPRYLLNTTAWESQGVSTANMLGLNGLVARLIGDRSPSPLFVLPFILPTLASVAYTWKGGWQPASPRFFLQVAITLLAALLINPHLYLQDMVLLGLVLTFCVAYSASSGNRMDIWLPVAIGVWFLLLYGPRIQVNHGIPLVAPAMICLLVICLRTLSKSHVEANEVESETPLALAA